LIVGGHTLGKVHGAADPRQHVGAEPEGASLEEQGLGWRNSFGSGNGKDTITSGLEGAWTSTPVQWSHSYFDNLFRYEWELTKSPAGAQQWKPKGDAGRNVPDAHDPNLRHQPMMLTTDLALITDPSYRKIAERFRDDGKQFEAAFARAWFKLTHRDMGPHARLLGKEVPAEQPWQDPIPVAASAPINEREQADLKAKILAKKLPIAHLAKAAWAAASTFRGSDLRGGANGARIRLLPQKEWAVNEPKELKKVLGALAEVQQEFQAAQGDGKRVSMADLIVLAGNAAVEEAARAGGHQVRVPFTPGRTDATQEMTDSVSFAALEPRADGFRNYLGKGVDRAAAEMLLDRAQLLTLSAPEMAVLLGGMRVLGANFGGSRRGVLTARPGALSNDFFVNLLDMGVAWRKDPAEPGVYEGVSRATGAVEWTASAVDLAFGSNSQLRAIAEVYAADDAKARFVADFVAAWAKVMDLDRFDGRQGPRQ
jgi:catalase-peroxidase